MAGGQGKPYFSTRSRSRLPALTPIRIGTPLASDLTKLAEPNTLNRVILVGKPASRQDKGATMPTVKLEEAQARLSELIETLIPGEELRILKDDWIIAKLTRELPPLKQPRKPG